MFATASANSCKKMQDIFTYRLEIYAKIIYIYTLRPASPDRLPEISISKENHVFFFEKSSAENNLLSSPVSETRRNKIKTT